MAKTKVSKEIEKAFDPREIDSIRWDHGEEIDIIFIGYRDVDA